MLKLLKNLKFYLILLNIFAVLLLGSCHNNIPCPVYANSDFELEVQVAG